MKSNGILHIGAHRGSEAPIYYWFGKDVIWIEANPKIYDDLKIYMILTIKWHFDYLAKTRRNPDELNSSIRFWFNILSIFKDFEKLGWINLPNRKKIKADVWKNTRKAFNFMWPKNTNKKKALEKGPFLNNSL